MTPQEAVFAVHAPGSLSLESTSPGRYQVNDAEASRIAIESDSAAIRSGGARGRTKPGEKTAGTPAHGYDTLQSSGR